MTDETDLALAHRLADAAGAAILPFFRKPHLTIEDKSGTGPLAFDPVTAADRAAETAIRDILAQEAPNDGVLGEEFGASDGSSGRRWIIDPIDGTKGFMTGLTSWGVLIALHDGVRSRLGVIDQPYTGERFVGRLGDDGASLRYGGETRRVTCRTCASLATATLVTTDPDAFQTDEEKRAYATVEARVRLRRLGTDCMGYAAVAGGWADIVIEAGLQPYDIQAAIPIIEAAGGVITDWAGNPDPWRGRIVASGDPEIHKQVLSVLSQVD